MFEFSSSGCTAYRIQSSYIHIMQIYWLDCRSVGCKEKGGGVGGNTYSIVFHSAWAPFQVLCLHSQDPYILPEHQAENGADGLLFFCFLKGFASFFYDYNMMKFQTTCVIAFRGCWIFLESPGLGYPQPITYSNNRGVLADVEVQKKLKNSPRTLIYILFHLAKIWMKWRKLGLNRHVLWISRVEFSPEWKPRDLNLNKLRIFKTFRLGETLFLFYFYFLCSLFGWATSQPMVFVHLFISGNILLGRRRLTLSQLDEIIRVVT